MRPFASMGMLRWLAPAFMVSMFAFFGCEETKEVVRTETVIQTDTVIVNIISVDEIFAEPDSITEGGSITLTASTTLEPEAGTVTLRWYADAGSFNVTEGDTAIWTAPDDPGAYTIYVHATDGQYIGIGTLRIGVGMYAPTTTPFYTGDMACAGCHASTHDLWAQTGHANAWETLQNSGHPASYCEPCHAVGWEPTPNNGNSGYDEAPVATFVNVQCENCHGAASEHFAGGTPDPTQINVSWNVENCGKCHDGTHHPYLSEWETSPHGFEVAGSVAERGGSCAGCHEGVAGGIRLAGRSASAPLDQFYGSGAVSERPDTTVFALENINCITCHDPHAHDNPGQIRTVADVPLATANGESPVITLGGTGKLCMHCHHARRAAEPQVASGYNHFGPHASPQADMMQGATGYHAVADPSFVWAGPSHLRVANSCKTCHLNMVEYDGTTAITGHTFLPTTAACANCHGTIGDFDEIMALDDFDGDGSVEGVQSEVLGMLDILQTSVIDTMLARGVDTTGVDWETLIGDTTYSTVKDREVAWNWFFVHDDKSNGIHNPDYAVQLLQQSLLYYNGALPRNTTMVTSDNSVMRQW